jgi:hypothetical protein
MHALGLFVAQLRGHMASADGNRLVDRIDDAVTLQSIARSGHRKNFPLICRAAARTPAASHSRLASGLWLGYGITISVLPEPYL